MSKRNRRLGLLIAGMIVCAVLARVAGKSGILPVLMGLLRTMLYISLYIGWGFSVSRRILQTQVRGYMRAISALTVFWFVVRSMKYYFVASPDAARHLWYWYYFPMLFIPLLSVFVSLSLGKPENYLLPKWTALLYVPTLVCLLLVLTNDLHQLVFTFPTGTVWGDKNYGYGIGYYFVIGWEIICALTAFVCMLVKCRVARRKKYLPALLLSCSIVYGLIYASGAQWMQVIGGDITAAQCLMFVGILECCIQCGLIQTNTGYYELFQAGTLGAQIAGPDGQVLYASANSPALSAQVMDAAREGTASLDKNTLLKCHPIDGGYVYWQEDITDITALLERLEENQETLAERNHLAQENYRVKREILALREKNRLYDLLQEKAGHQIDLLSSMFSRYDAEPDPEKRRVLLAQMAVIGAYIKRGGNLLFICETTEVTDMAELSFCLEESLLNLKLLGVACAADIPTGVKILARDAIAAYDFFEGVIETAMDSLHSVWLKARSRTGSAPRTGCVALRLEVECEASLSELRDACENSSFEDGVWRFILPVRTAGGRP